jgi:hypothetical protein
MTVRMTGPLSVSVARALAVRVAPPPPPPAAAIARLLLGVLPPIRLRGRLAAGARLAGGGVVMGRPLSVRRAISMRLSGLAVSLRGDPAVAVLMTVRQG